MMKLGEIDFGPTDARHMIFGRFQDQQNFKRMFLMPANLDVQRFIDGRKSIVYGIKGAGKSAFLKYLELSLSEGAHTRFFYFRKENDKFFDKVHGAKASGDEISNLESLQKVELRDFWSAFLMLAMASELQGIWNERVRSFVSVVKSALGKKEGLASALSGKVMIIDKFIARLKAAPELEVTGYLEKSELTLPDFEELLALLKGAKIDKPIYFFFDEMEISFTSQSGFSREVELISALVETLRGVNEILRKYQIPIYFICAIRKEISHRILGGDISKIVNDLGQEITWTRRTWSKANKDFIHPLFQIILRRIAFSEDPQREQLPTSVALRIIEERFPAHIRSGNIQKDVLDLTMYRPRDCALLLGIASQIDSERVRFRPETFKVDIHEQFGERLWVDIQEALSSKYCEAQIDAIKAVLAGLREEFAVEDFFTILDDYVYDPAVAPLIDEGTDFWIGILRDLFELGAVGNKTDDGKFRFRFRGQGSLSVRKSERILVHQSLRSQLV